MNRMRKVWNEVAKQFPKKLAPTLIVVFAVIFIVAVLTTLLFTFRGSRERPSESQLYAPQSYRPRDGEGDQESTRSGFTPEPLNLTDFVLETTRDPLTNPHFYFYREPKNRWTEEEVQRFWIPTQEVILDIVVHENNKQIEDMLE